MWRPYGIEGQNYEHNPLTVEQVKERFPKGFAIILIEDGIAAITDQKKEQGWYADFRPVIGSVSLEPMTSLKRYHRKKLDQKFARLRTKLVDYLYGSPVYHLSVVND